MGPGSDVGAFVFLYAIIRPSLTAVWARWKSVHAIPYGFCMRRYAVDLRIE